MNDRAQAIRAVFLAVLMVLSVFAAGAMAATATTGGTDSATNATQTVAVEEDSAKSLTISWFRDDGDSNGPYPVMPTEYGEDTSGIQMIGNAEGDAQLRVDNSTALNPNGQWDMLALHVETDGLEALNPPSEGPDKGLVTQEFIQNDNWNVDIEQTNGDKTLNVADNQDGYENPPGVDEDVPPVMVFADTDVVEGDYTVGDDPDTGIYVWVDPNRATLMENGEEVSFEPGEEYEATFQIDGETESTTFTMVQGDVTMPEQLSPANTAQSTISARTTLAAGSEVEVELAFENGDTMSETVEVEGNMEYGGDTKGTVPQGYVNATFDLTGKQNQDFTATVYAPGPEGGVINGSAVRDDDEYLSEENRIQVAEGSGSVRDVIDPDYTIDNATIYDSMMLTIAYHNDAISPSGLGEQIGDGHATGDFSLAKNTDGHERFDEMWLLYETTDVSEAIEVSPGSNQIEKFQNSPISLEIEQTNADGSPIYVNLSRNASGVSVFNDNGDSDPRAYNQTDMVGVLFSLWPNEMQFYQDGEPVEPEIGDEFAATLTIETDEGTQTETIDFEIVDGRTVLASDELRLPQSPNAEVVFNTTQSTGTAMSINVKAVADNGSVIMETDTGEMKAIGSGPILAGKHGTSNPWGSISTTIDTTGLPIGTDIVAEARIVADVPDDDLPEDQDYLVVERVNGTIRAPPSAEMSLSAQSGAGESFTIDRLNLSDGGFVSLHTGSPTGTTIGTSSYLEAGVQSDLEISLDEALSEDTEVYVIAHLDTNGNQQYDFPTADDPYTSGGSAVIESVQYTVESMSTTTDEPTTTTSDSGSDMTTADDTTDDGDSGSGSGPGFGVVLALLALLAVAGIALRRQ